MITTEIYNEEQYNIPILTLRINYDNQTLKEIHLEENSIDENGIKSFSMLSQCATECKVFLSKGKVDYEKNKEIIDGNKNLVLV